ncbi:MAG: Rieske 2Fe-2S domain-containing protein [Oscillochloris sp.]|nr:Rieske 2Fe-2S domain-containing protein [Oscillochloris sp.]
MTQQATEPMNDFSRDLDTLAEQVDRAMREVQKLENDARSKATDLKKAIEEFHKVGLTTIVQRLKNDPRGKELLFELVDDPLVYALFAMHGIVRADMRTRVVRVLEMVRPYMQGHGGDVEFVDVRDNIVYVRLHGACNGCSMSAVTLREGVEEALKHNIPEIRQVEVVPSDPGPAMISLDAITVSKSDVGWVQGPALELAPPGTMTCIETATGSVLVVNNDNKLSAYRNACAHLGRRLDDGTLDANGVLTCAGHGFQFDTTSGECVTAPQAQLEPFPLRVKDGYIWVRPQ